MDHKGHMRTVFLLIIVTVLAFTGAFNQRTTLASLAVQQAKSADDGYPIRIVLQISKPIYRVGDPVEVIVLLENPSQDKVYFVGREMYRADLHAPFHYVEFALSDENRKPLRLFDGASVEDPIIKFGSDRKPVSPPRRSIRELTTQEYVQLGPGAVYGFRARLYKPGTTPGHYRLSVSYREVEALERTAAELRTLPIPIWTKPLISNSVEFTVTR